MIDSLCDYYDSMLLRGLTSLALIRWPEKCVLLHKLSKITPANEYFDTNRGDGQMSSHQCICLPTNTFWSKQHPQTASSNGGWLVDGQLLSCVPRTPIKCLDLLVR